jgi:hypothetical protein
MPTFGDGSLLNVKTNAQLEAEDRFRALQASSKPEVVGLAAHLRQLWEQAKRAKVPHELKMLEDLRQRDGVYDPADAEMIRQQGGSDIYLMVTSTMCRAASAWIKDIMLPADDRPWAIEPTEIPTLPPEVQAEIDKNLASYKFVMQARLQAGQIPPDSEYWESLQGHLSEIEEEMQEKRKAALMDEAKERAEGMTDRIEDQLEEGNYYRALAECIEDFVTYPAAILHGPIVRRRKRMQWVQDKDTGNWTPKAEDALAAEFERVSPFDIYPLPQSWDIQKHGFFHRMKLSVDELSAMIGVPGYHESSIRAAIDQYARGGLREWLNADAPRAVAEGRPHEYLHAIDTIDCLSFWGKVPGKLLLDFGMSTDDVPDRSLSYEVNAWLVGAFVVRAILNPNPLAKRPYGMASYERIPGAWWGKAIPRLGRSYQRMCNAAGRSIANNMAIGSGPQVVVKDTSRLPAGENIESLYPWKIWQLTADKSGRGGSDQPIDFFQPNTMVDQLLAVYGYFSKLYNDVVAIPASAYGSDKAAGAAQTASGQAMLENNASRTMKGVIYNIDEGLIRVPVENLFMHEMLYGDNPAIKGDLVIRAKGAATLMVKEVAQMRRIEFLGATNNPTDLQILGIDGRAAVLREVSNTLEMDKNVVPDSDELAQRVNPVALPGLPAVGIAGTGQRPANPVEADLSGMRPAGGVEATLV